MAILGGWMIWKHEAEYAFWGTRRMHPEVWVGGMGFCGDVNTMRGCYERCVESRWI